MTKPPPAATLKKSEGRARRLVKSVGAWMGEQVRARGGGRRGGHGQYMRLVEHVPTLLRYVPSAGRLRDVKHYLHLFCYFIQPTPANVRAMLLYALKHYAAGAGLRHLKPPPPETMPAAGIYHPDAPALFASFEDYRRWYERRRGAGPRLTLDPARTVGLLLMRTQIVSDTRRHYDALVRAIEREGLAVIPAISTFMDNREACEKFFIQRQRGKGEKVKRGRGRRQNPFRLFPF